MQLNNNRPLKNILRVKWAKELKLNKEELNGFYKYKVISKRYIVKAELSSFI